jgi:hypothetical protein
MTARRDPWFSLSIDALSLALEVHSVIGLRMMKAAWGGAAARDEGCLMITEKAKAVMDAQFLFASSLMAGQGALAPARAVALMRRRVQANQRRLTRGD